MYTATDSHTIHFHQLQRGTADRIRNRRVNERTGEEVELGDIVKGYDTGEEYVLVEPAELDEIAPGRSQTLEITSFVDLDDVEPIFFDKTYYLGPRGKEYAKVYALLQKALSSAKRRRRHLRDARPRVPRRPQGRRQPRDCRHVRIFGCAE